MAFITASFSNKIPTALEISVENSVFDKLLYKHLIRLVPMIHSESVSATRNGQEIAMRLFGNEKSKKRHQLKTAGNC